MKAEYDISTKEKEISYLKIVDEMLDKLGFRKNLSGTKMIRNLSIYIYLKDPLVINLKKEIINYVYDNNIEISYIVFRSSLDYAVEKLDKEKFKNNFYSVFEFDYDCYFISTKCIVSFIVSLLEKNKY